MGSWMFKSLRVTGDGADPAMAVQLAGGMSPGGPQQTWPGVGLASLAWCTLGQGKLPQATEPQFPHLELRGGNPMTGIAWGSNERDMGSMSWNLPAPLRREEGQARRLGRE